jgi:hypothetical protein
VSLFLAEGLFEKRAFAHGGGKGWANVSATTNLCSLDPHKTLHRTQDLQLLLLSCAAQKMWTESTQSWWSSFFADVKMPVNKCHHTSQVCSGVLKGLWLACPVVKNG